VIYSHQEKNLKKESLALHECSDWNLIKKKEVRCLLLENFIISQNSGFNRAQQKKLLSSLMLAIQLKIIINEDIIIHSGNIVEIEKWEQIKNLHLKEWDFNIKKKVKSKK